METTMPTQAASSSTRAARSAKVGQHVRVRRKDAQTVFLVTPVDEAQRIQTRHGLLYARAGDLQITKSDGTVENVVPPELLNAMYERVDEGSLTLSADHITRLGKLLQFGGTRSSESLVQAVEQLVHVSIGGVDIEWTPAQVDELKHRASKRGWTVEQYVKFLVDRFTQDMWTLG